MRITVSEIQRMKERNERIAALTAYDYATARIVDEAGVPLVLVGDSLGMVVLGYENTIPVRLDDILHHTRAVTRGCRRALVVADMPFMTYATIDAALENAARCIQEGAAQAVKLEGGRSVAGTIARVTSAGIPVMAHIGLTPQSVHQLGGFKGQGRSLEQAKRLLDDAAAVEEAGAFSIVLECIPVELARLLTDRLAIPTIGIGAGPHCDGEIQVISDILGLVPDFIPRHTKQYAQLGDAIREAVDRYAEEVRTGEFPTQAQSTTMDRQVLGQLEALPIVKPFVEDKSKDSA